MIAESDVMQEFLTDADDEQVSYNTLSMQMSIETCLDYSLTFSQFKYKHGAVTLLHLLFSYF